MSDSGTQTRHSGIRARHNGIRIRPIDDGDWDGIVALESHAYTALGLSEGRAALRSKADTSPSTCFVLDVGSRTVGYLLALPYPPLQFPALARSEGEGSAALPSCNLHLHDIVIAQGFRRRGLAQRLLHHLTSLARSRGYERISLVAVGRSERFWSARGFAEHPGAVRPGGYGPNAVYMSKALPDEVS